MNRELKIDSLAYMGSGVGRADGKVWFVPFTHPGDILHALPVKEKKHFVIGKIKELSHPAAERIEPACPYFGTCGGCHWQMASYPLQIEEKLVILTETLNRKGITLPGLPEVRKAPEEWGYRNRIQMRLTKEGLPGFYRAGSKDLIPVGKCPLAAEPINTVLKELYAEAEARPGALREKYPDGFEIRLKTDNTADITPLKKDSKEAGDFGQVNTAVNEILRKEVKLCLTEIDETKTDFRIVDLYCGDGNLSLPLAENAASIHGWDGSRTAINRAKAGASGLEAPLKDNVAYHTGYIEKHKGDITEASAKADLLILDPPRKGIKGVEEFISHLGVENIIYVSCSPPALARDLAFLTENGYRVEKTVMLDMFPQTYHLETLIRLRKV